MGRKIKKVIMIAAFGMVTGGQIADLLPEGNVMQVEAGSRKQIIKVKNKGNTIFLKEGTSELGLGTGFIVTSEGYIVTNQHVSGDKNSTCYVTLEDGRNYEATVVWADSDIDLSVVKINAKNLEFLKLGDSENIKIAQKVYAIGNPIGYEFQRTVTSGIISGLERTIKIEENDKNYYMENLIQTDATINLGNSGGPLINENGEVIGINSVKITTAEGIGFAIPINNVKPIIKKLEEKQIKAKANRKSADYQTRNQANSEVYYNRCILFALNTAWYIVKHNVDAEEYINTVMSNYKKDQGWNGYGNYLGVDYVKEYFSRRVKSLIENEKTIRADR